MFLFRKFRNCDYTKKCIRFSLHSTNVFLIKCKLKHVFKSHDSIFVSTEISIQNCVLFLLLRKVLEYKSNLPYTSFFLNKHFEHNHKLKCNYFFSAFFQIHVHFQIKCCTQLIVFLISQKSVQYYIQM